MIGKELPSIQETIYESIIECEDYSKTTDLYKNIILSGGNTMFQGIAERLLMEIEARAPIYPKPTVVKIIASPDRYYAAWRGGS